MEEEGRRPEIRIQVVQTYFKIGKYNVALAGFVELRTDHTLQYLASSTSAPPADRLGDVKGLWVLHGRSLLL